MGYSPWGHKESDTTEVQDQGGGRLGFSTASSWLADGYIPLWSLPSGRRQHPHHLCSALAHPWSLGVSSRPLLIRTPVRWD